MQWKIMQQEVFCLVLYMICLGKLYIKLLIAQNLRCHILSSGKIKLIFFCWPINYYTQNMTLLEGFSRKLSELCLQCYRKKKEREK